MIRFLTAGESHGKALTVIVDGIPSNLKLENEYLNYHLKRRQAGYGRSQRMKIETDTAEIISGIRFRKTLGSPISLIIKNKDWENWKDVMSSGKGKKGIEKVTVPRPGHADMVGITKFNHNDIRNSIERSSARETAARVAAGAVARRFLEEFNIFIGSCVESIGGEFPDENIFENLALNKISKNFSAWNLSLQSDKSDVRVLDKDHEDRIINKIKKVKKSGDTLGGTFVTVASGVPPGIGSFMQYDLKLDADIASAVMSINAVKAVSIGTGFESAERTGSESHDEIIRSGEKLTRKTNRAGGIEGGVSNGMPIFLRSAMKPIATLMSPIKSVDLRTLKKNDARRERSDFVAVPACAVISESMLAWIIAKHFLIKFGGDSIDEIKDNYNNYSKKLFTRLRRNFK
jgi:chorismate synthase